MREHDESNPDNLHVATEHPHTSLREKYTQSRHWVVKIGSAMITNDGAGIDKSRIQGWADDIAQLHQTGKHIVMVSSGAIAAGMQRLGWTSRPSDLAKLQAAAAVGQMQLMEAYEQAFDKHGIKTAQVLVTHEDCADRNRYLNIRMTLRALLEAGVIPIVNENDAVAYDEIRFGDNDSIGAWMANSIEAGLYLILTDQDGLYTANPAIDPTAELIPQVSAEDKSLLALASGGGRLGSGGMLTKLQAAQRAAKSGSATIIAPGARAEIITMVAQAKEIGTLFVPTNTRQAARKQWLMAQLQIAGRLYVDTGAAKALSEQGKSLLAVGAVSVEGEFSRGDLVAIIGPMGQELARGLSNYDSIEANLIVGKSSEQIAAIMGGRAADALVHRDNLVLI